MAKRLLIVHAGQHATGIATRLALTAQQAASAVVDVACLRALDADAEDLLAADGLLIVTPEKFGYMAGALKDFFDRGYYPVLEHMAGRPYALVVTAGTDGQGTVQAVERILTGLRMRAMAPALVVRGEPNDDATAAVAELAAALAQGLADGVF
jgi:multimeric flavodoxin WrbA